MLSPPHTVNSSISSSHTHTRSSLEVSELGAGASPVLPDEVSAVAEQVLLGGPTQFEGPEVVEAHLGRARLAGIPTKQVMNLEVQQTGYGTRETWGKDE